MLHTFPRVSLMSADDKYRKLLMLLAILRKLNLENKTMNRERTMCVYELLCATGGCAQLSNKRCNFQVLKFPFRLLYKSTLK